MRMKTKILCRLLLAVFTVIGFLPMIVQASAPASNQGIWLGGTSTGVNMVQGSDVTYLETDASTEITTTEPASWVARYDGAGTLTLRGGTFDSGTGNGLDGGLHCSGEDNLTLQLEGNVTIKGGRGIFVEQGNLTITGQGTLNTPSGIYVMGTLNIQDGTINSSGSYIAGFLGINISGGNVTTHTDRNAINTLYGVNMSGGMLTAISDNDSAIWAGEVKISNDLMERVMVGTKSDGSDAIIWNKTSLLYSTNNPGDEASPYSYIKIGGAGYAMIEGQGENWTEDSSGNLTFRANGDFDKFTGVKVDGSLVSPENYTAVSGSTIVTLKNEYLKTLSPGEHKISIVYVDGEAVANFKIGTQATNSKSNSSSDSSSRPAVYAQGETYGDIRVEKSGTKATVIRREGNEIETIVHPYISGPSRKVVQAAGVYAVDLTLVDAYNDYSFVTLKKGPVDVTFYVPGVEWDTEVLVRQWIGDHYVDVPVKAGSGSIKATFETLSVSTIVIMVGPDGIAAGTAATPATGMVSPKTGETSTANMAGFIAILSLSGIVICEKKRKAER